MTIWMYFLLIYYEYRWFNLTMSIKYYIVFVIFCLAAILNIVYNIEQADDVVFFVASSFRMAKKTCFFLLCL